MLDAAVTPGILDGAPPPLSVTPAKEYSSIAAGALIGAFTIDKLLARGGMGEVYLAHRTATDFEQRVALKILRAEAAGQEALFERERRLLARLEHRGIARLIDGGLAPDGRAFMAMEFIDGEPIDAWCVRNDADLDARLRLFCEMCDAVAYAHANFVVHLDLKPSNILVDSTGSVRLLDFGIAKLLDETAVIPAATQAMLTPDYAAPEQLEGEPATVVTDVYALGVILFELVTGTSPWRRGSTSAPATIRRILYDDPPVPSEVMGQQSKIARSRITGDIDAIILKALRRTPADRYRSVDALGEDVRRHQSMLPVRAREGAIGYRVGRFVRRYRWAVGASAAALCALMIGAGGIAWQARETAIERDQARSEAGRSEAIIRMLTLMFRESGSGEEVSVKQMLDRAAKQVVDSTDKTAKSATLVTAIADLYVNIDDPAGADVLLHAALDKGVGANDAVATAQMKLRYASTAAALGRTEGIGPMADQADAVFKTDPARFRKERLELISARAQLARRTGDYDGAIRLLSDSLPEADRVYTEDRRELFTRYNNLLVYMVEANQLDAMPVVFAQADAAFLRTGETGGMQELGITQLKGVWLSKRNDFKGAERIFQQVSRKRLALFGKSAALAVDLLQLGRAQLALGKFHEARATLNDAQPMAKEFLGDVAPPTLFISLGLAEAMAETGDITGAAQQLSQIAVKIAEIKKIGLIHGAFTRTQAILFLRQGRIEEARRELDRAEKIFTELGSPGKSYLAAFPTLRARIASGR